jgi:selenide,water dikinase
VHPSRVLIKGGLRPGDRLFLSKPLGTGVITTAGKDGVAPAEVLEGAVRSMCRLNRVAAQVARESGATGATDITGFGFLGHATEMVVASRAGIGVEAARIPLLPGALALAEAGHFSGGMRRNRRHVESVLAGGLQIASEVPAVLVSILMEAETSGGLLFSVQRDRADGVLAAFRRAGEDAWAIGEVLDEPVVRIRP